MSVPPLSRQQRIDAAAIILRDAIERQDAELEAKEIFQGTAWLALEHANQLSVEEHARRAHRVGGPSIAELERQIRNWRAGRDPLDDGHPEGAEDEIDHHR